METQTFQRAVASGNLQRLQFIRPISEPHLSRAFADRTGFTPETLTSKRVLTCLVINVAYKDQDTAKAIQHRRGQVALTRGGAEPSEFGSTSNRRSDGHATREKDPGAPERVLRRRVRCSYNRPRSGTAPRELPTFAALLSLWHTWLSYAVSYLFIAIVWANHHHLMHYATEATPRLMWFNFAHLFSVSLLPFSTAWMAVSKLAPQPVAFYAAVFFLVNATYIALI